MGRLADWRSKRVSAAARGPIMVCCYIYASASHSGVARSGEEGLTVSSVNRLQAETGRMTSLRYVMRSTVYMGH